MSFILDALKKSEAERQRQAGPALLEMRIVRPTRRLPAWAIVVGVLLCGCVLALAWMALRRPGPPAAPPAPPAAAPAAAAAPANGAASAASGAGAGAVTGAQVTAAAPAAGMASAPAAPVAALAPPAAAAAPQPPVAAGDDENPADAAPAEPPSAGMARERTDTSSLRSYAELGGTLPELRLDLHVYAAKPAERYAFINMHKVREGDVTPEGVAVREITPDGVVLEYHGTEFLLGR